MLQHSGFQGILIFVWIHGTKLLWKRKTRLPAHFPVTKKKLRHLSYLPKLGLTEGKGVHEGLSDDGQAAVQMRSLLYVENKLGVFQDVDPEAQRQTAQKQSNRPGFKIRNMFFFFFLSF